MLFVVQKLCVLVSDLKDLELKMLSACALQYITSF